MIGSLCDHLLTLMSFQICMPFYFFRTEKKKKHLRFKNMFFVHTKNISVVQCCLGPHSWYG